MILMILSFDLIEIKDTLLNNKRIKIDVSIIIMSSKNKKFKIIINSMMSTSWHHFIPKAFYLKYTYIYLNPI